MDISAVLSANDDVLKDMGLSTAGDRLSLRGFCTTSQEDMQKNKEKESKRKRLLDAFLSSKKDKSKKLETSGKQEQKKKLEKEKKKSKRVQIGWKHFRAEDQIYAQVPLAKGGGSRCETMPLSSNSVNKNNFVGSNMKFYSKYIKQMTINCWMCDNNQYHNNDSYKSNKVTTRPLKWFITVTQALQYKLD